MRPSLKSLVEDPRFIPFVYDYCDMRCESCRVSHRCLLLSMERERAQRATRLSEEARVAEAIAAAREIVEHTPPRQKAIAQLDLALCDISTAPREPALGHPLEFLGQHYAIQAEHFFESLDPPPQRRPPRGSPLDIVCWDHNLIAYKTYRSLVSHFASEHTPELLPDALASAKSALVCIDRSLEAWRAIAAHEGDARIGGLIDLLEALRTGLEMRFPEARGFRRPGLDDGDA
jgi:hypothetical protein